MFSRHAEIVQGHGYQKPPFSLGTQLKQGPVSISPRSKTVKHPNKIHKKKKKKQSKIKKGHFASDTISNYAVLEGLNYISSFRGSRWGYCIGSALQHSFISPHQVSTSSAGQLLSSRDCQLLHSVQKNVIQFTTNFYFL